MPDWRVESYVDDAGRSPVETFLDRLPADDRARIIRTVEMLQDFGLQLSLPYVKHLENKLWELRVQAGRKAYRVLYFAWTGQRFILLHAFLKKSAKTPRQELAIAESRLADFLSREGKP